VLTLRLASGEVRNLTRSPGVAERSPAWSPDGRWIAYFSDESGEYQIHLHPIGESSARKIAIEARPSFYRQLTWSPDSRNLAFCDDRMVLWHLELATGRATRVVRGTYGFGNANFDPSWSPDSRWLAYSMFRPNYLRSVYLYSLAKKESHPVTDGRADTYSPVFDQNGEHLYYVRAGNLGLNLLGMSRFPFEATVPYSVHAVILRDDGLPPASAGKDTSGGTDPPLRIGVADISRRTLRLFGAASGVRLSAGERGALYAHFNSTLYRMGPGTPNLQTVAQGVGDFRVSADGNRIALQRNGQWSVMPAGAAPMAQEEQVDLGRVQIEVDPRAEWRQIFHESCRIARDYFFDPGLHGQQIQALERKYAAYLPQVVTREGLNDLLWRMLANLSVSHLSVGGGDVPPTAGEPENTGLLGADYRIDAGRYQLARVYRAASPNEASPGPLAAPGLNVREGEYLLEVEGQPFTASDNLYQRLIGKAGKSVMLRIGPRADGEGSRQITVRPATSERAIRELDWVESRRRMVEALSGGRLAYLYLPDTGNNGFAIFNREFYAQLDKEGLILDERFNGGGEPADYIIEALQRAPISGYAFRDGKEMPFPTGCINGPKVMIINEAAGSGGDTLPWMFRAARLGTLVGKRTQGATIGNWVTAPSLIDGGTVQPPNRALYDPRTGLWDVENRGVAPDVEVETLPAEWLAGRDRQIEAAVRVALARRKKRPPAKPKPPSRGAW
jgi:tricorn protease